MKELPENWYERSMAPLREEAKSWPEWMLRGVADARERAEQRAARYADMQEVERRTKSQP